MQMSKASKLAAAATIAALALGACGSSNNSSGGTGTSAAATGTSAAASGTSAATGTSAASGTSGSTSGTSGAGTAAQVFAPPSSTVDVSETGSTLLYPLFQEWQKAYPSIHSNISITPQGTGSGTGISQAEAKTIDIGASDAYLPPSAFTQYKGIENIAVDISAQMINYNVPGVSGNLKLSPTVIAEMYTGKITKWNDPAIAKLNPGVSLPSLKVVPVHRSDGSGDTFLFTGYLTDAAPSIWTAGQNTTVNWPNVPAATSAQGNGGMVTTCGQTKGCIAYIGISYRSETQSAGLGEAAIQNKAGNFELPTPTTIEAEAAGFVAKTPANEAISLEYGPASNGYPIINYEYAIVDTSMGNSAAAQAVKAVLSWGLDPQDGSAPKYLVPINFQPLPSSVIKLSDAQIAKIK
ncbi:MAG: phosphate ABC transporter substrate-binding protein PstS [Acidimicrobiales bacterium]